MQFYLTAIIVLIIDQVSKFIVLHHLKPIEGMEIIPGFFRLYYATNTGGAFSILSDNTAILMIFSFVAIVVIFAWQFTLPRRDWAMRISLGLIFGGAIGNLIDRFARGYVIDFLDFHWRYKLHWPTFNFADTFICVGVGLIVVLTVFPQLHHKLIGIPTSKKENQ